MAHSNWKASSFLAKTSIKPIQYAVVGVVTFFLFGLIAATKYEVDYRVVVSGEVVSKLGEHEVKSPNDGVVELKRLTIGQNVMENETIGYLKIPFADHQKVEEILVKMHKLFEDASKTKSLNNLIWPELDSENPFISEQLLKAKDAIENYNHEVQNNVKSIDLKAKNRSNYKKFAKMENDYFIKSADLRSRMLATLKYSYLKIFQFKDDHVVKSFSTGKISKISTSKYQQIKKDQTLLVLSPIDEEFEFKLRIPTYIVGKISENLQLKGEIDSFPYQKFGLFTGTVSRVDKILTQDEGQSFYNAYASIQNPQHVARHLASSIQLLPGMKVKAHIVLKKITLTQLIYEKLFLPNGDL